MSQGGKRSEKRNGFKICKPYPSSLESSRSKDDHSTSEIKSVAYSGDHKIRHRNIYNSKKYHNRKSLKSPLVNVRKDTDSNDSGFRRNFDYSHKHQMRLHHHHHHEDNFLTSKNSRTGKPNCHKIVHCESNKRGSESSREEKSRILENDRCRRLSSIEVNEFSDRNSLCNIFNSEKNKKDYSKNSSKCNHINDRKNRIRDEEKEKDRVPEFVNWDHKISSLDGNEKREKIEESYEGSARTRGFYFKRKEDEKSCKKVNEISRKGKSVENSSKKAFDSKLDKTKKTKKIDNKEIKVADAKEENLKCILNPTTESSIESRKIYNPSRKSSKRYQKKFKIKEGISNSNLNLNSENDISEEGKVKNFINDSEMKIEDSKIIEFQDMKKSRNNNKNQKRKGTRYKSSQPELKRKKLRYLIYLIRKSILTDREENKSEDRDRKIKISKENSCIRIKQENKIESDCESSGYNSLQNIQDRLSEINKNKNSETNFSTYLESAYLKNSPNKIEFLDTEKFCIYKIYKSPDGGILLKESQSQEFKKGEYVIGKRILKEPETLLQFSKNSTSEKNVNQLFSQRNSSTQTEINLTSTQISRKKSWFRKSYTKRCQNRSKKYFASLESTSNSSFPESSDFEQFNLPLRGTKKMRSPSSKKPLLNLLNTSAHFLKTSRAVDTSDLNYFTSVKNPEEKIVIPFNNSENENNLGYLDYKRENTATPLCDKSELLFNAESIKSGEHFSSVPPLIPVSCRKLDNPEFIAQKINVEEMIRVEMENNCNFIQSTEFQIKKPELIYSEGCSQDRRLKNKKKSSGNFFRIFKRKKKYNRIKFKDEKLKK